jgi:ubiquinol-cytochrome c reductase cytochrome c subunit
MTLSSSCLRVFVATVVAVSYPVRLKADPTHSVRLKADPTYPVRLQPDRPDRGRDTYVRVGCYQCHGREAQGASTGPRLGPDPVPIAAFTRAVRTPRNDMPPYSTRILSERELADIYAFVSSRPRPQRVLQ